MKQLIAGGLGFVGSQVSLLFPDADIFDTRQDNTYPRGHYDIVHCCVPTPAYPNGSCDISYVREVLENIDSDLFIIRSTLPPGTCESFENELNKDIVFQPEYCASASPYPAPLADIRKHPFLILGGREENTKKARRLYERVYAPTTVILETSATTAELIKLFENTVIANKVTLCGEFYAICEQFGVDYDTVREAVFKLDPRMTPWWTIVYPERRGWSSSHCLPKDLSNLIHSCQKIGYEPQFIMDIVKRNEEQSA